eukprot:GHVP01021439.1.p1 GENE.GHVP01021439.1~~GHVP01021439.1.p1  ORF type:complete len:752 (+),score=103.02 GHVP01021439.1:56-2311(+)
MDYGEHEAQTGVRFSWNLWPPTREGLTKLELPLGCLYTPLKDLPRDIPLLTHEPVRCRDGNCGCVLNPFCHIDVKSRTWLCQTSMQRNPFPPRWAEAYNQNGTMPELISPCVEYILPSNPHKPPCFLFVANTSLVEEEFDQLRETLQQALSLVNPDSFVGLITFGKMVQVHEIGFSECPKAFVFRGDKDYKSSEIQSKLGLTYGAGKGPTQVAQGASLRFLQRARDCELALTSLLDDVPVDAWALPQDCRSYRSTGAAINIAVSLMEACCAGESSKILLFTGGPCTHGPGLVVDMSLAEHMRGHLDLQKETNIARHVKPALKFYTSIAQRAVSAAISIDIFSCSFDQTGLYEMQVMSDKTGGQVIMSDSFTQNVFSDSLIKIFDERENSLKFGYNATLDILCSKEFKVCGAIGACSSNNKKTSQVGDTVVGEGGTSQWSIACMNRLSTIAFYFEIVNQNVQNLPPGKQSFLQFQTVYNHPSGNRRMRICTVSYRYAEPNSAGISRGFDQEAAAVLMARLAVHKTETEEPLDVLRWLDRKLIRLVSRFSEHQKDNVESFHLSSEFAIYPQFIYHLRRSPFLQTFNASPDETAYNRTTLLRETVTNSLVMIQPALLQYSFNNGAVPEPVLLDVQSLNQDSILLLDSFFHVVIWLGEHVHNWKMEGYQEKPEYDHFKKLLQTPMDDAKAILEDRFPAPKFVYCNAGGSQARFLLAKVNPSATYSHPGMAGDSVVVTDDVALDVFMQHLVKLAVQ